MIFLDLTDNLGLGIPIGSKLLIIEMLRLIKPDFQATARFR